jgi:hypothetical protein
LTKISKKNYTKKKISAWSKNFDTPIFSLSRPKNSVFSEEFPYGVHIHFVEQKKLFNLNIKKKIFFNKADQKLRDPQKPIFG